MKGFEPPRPEEMPEDPFEGPRDPLALPQLASVLRKAWTWTRRLVLGALAFVTFVFLLEIVHLHRLLAEVHPVLAWVVSGLLLAGTIGLLGYAAWRWWSVPRALLPPDLPAPEAGWSAEQRRVYLSFARRYLERQVRNPALEEDARARIRARLEELAAGRWPGEPEGGDAALVRRVEGTIDELIEGLDRRARVEIWRAASQVAVLTALNPSALLDVLITLLRNVELMARLARIYYGRPGVVGTVRIVRDVFAVAATAGLIERISEGASDAIAEIAGSWTTRLAGPIGQGLVNGLLTVRLGQAATLRCRSLRSRRVALTPWSRAALSETARELSKIIRRQIAPSLGRGFRRAERAAAEGDEKRWLGWLPFRRRRERTAASDEASAASGAEDPGLDDLAEPRES